MSVPSWPWSYGSWTYDSLCNKCLSPLKLWVRIPLRRRVCDTTLGDKVWHWLATSRWFSPDTPVSSTNKTDRHDITEILLKVVLNIITLTLEISKKWIQLIYSYFLSLFLLQFYLWLYNFILFILNLYCFPFMFEFSYYLFHLLFFQITYCHFKFRFPICFLISISHFIIITASVV